MMTRKEALKIMTLVGGGVLIGLEQFISGCKNPSGEELVFQPDRILTLDEIGDTIIPDTAHSPGAKAAQIGLFMQTIVRDCYDKSEQAIFVQGFEDFDKRCQDKFGKDFRQLASEEKLAFLTVLHDEQKETEKKRSKRKSETEPSIPPHYFTMLKQLTIWGYFTSEIGQTKEMNYRPVPGRYEPCINYQKGDKAFC